MPNDRALQSGFAPSPVDELNDLRLSAKALTLLEHVKRFIAVTMSLPINSLSEGADSVGHALPTTIRP